MNSKHTVFLPKIVRNTSMFTYQWKWVNTCPGLSSSAALFVPLFLIVSLKLIVFPEMRENVLVGDRFLFCVAFMASPRKTSTSVLLEAHFLFVAGHEKRTQRSKLNTWNMFVHYLYTSWPLSNYVYIIQIYIHGNRCYILYFHVFKTSNPTEWDLFFNVTIRSVFMHIFVGKQEKYLLTFHSMSKNDIYLFLSNLVQVNVEVVRILTLSLSLNYSVSITAM